MRLGTAIGLAGASGFVALSYEILWYRVFSFATAGAAPSFALLLGAYLLGIAWGAAFARRFCPPERGSGPGQLRVVAWFVLGANLAAYLSIPTLGWMFADAISFWPTLVPVVLVAGLLGAQLPLISHYGIPPDDRAGVHLSWLYLANILGSVAGSLLTGFVMFDQLTLAQTAVVVTLVGIVIATALLALSWPGRAAGVGLVCAALVLGSTSTLYHGVYERLLFKAEYAESEPFAHVIETKSGVITVTRDDVAYGGGAYDGHISTDLVAGRGRIVLAYSLPLLHPRPRRVLMIGLATGSWATVMANHPDLERLVVVEINPGYLELIRRYPKQARLLDDPRVEIVIDDGRRYLRREAERFDVIVANTTWHWRALASSILSVEYQTLVRARLAEGGAFMLQTTSSPRVYRTAAAVFPHTLRLLNLVVASERPLDIKPERWRAALERYSIYGEPVFDLSQESHRTRLDHIVSIGAALGTEEEGRFFSLESSERVRARVQAERPITDDNMGTEWEQLRLLR